MTLMCSGLVIRPSSQSGSAGRTPQAASTASGNFAACAVDSTMFGIFESEVSRSATASATAVCGSTRSPASRQAARIAALVSVSSAIRAAWREAGDLVDPHTAVALAVADRDITDSRIPNIVLSTAHAAKFPDAVEAACGVRPELPHWLEGLMTKPEHIKIIKNDQVEVERFVRSVSRAAKQGVAG